jgi:hypothetical protein
MFSQKALLSNSSSSSARINAYFSMFRKLSPRYSPSSIYYKSNFALDNALASAQVAFYPAYVSMCLCVYVSMWLCGYVPSGYVNMTIVL